MKILVRVDVRDQRARWIANAPSGKLLTGTKDQARNFHSMTNAKQFRAMWKEALGDLGLQAILTIETPGA